MRIAFIADSSSRAGCVVECPESQAEAVWAVQRERQTREAPDKAPAPWAPQRDQACAAPGPAPLGRPAVGPAVPPQSPVQRRSQSPVQAGSVPSGSAYQCHAALPSRPDGVDTAHLARLSFEQQKNLLGERLMRRVPLADAGLAERVVCQLLERDNAELVNLLDSPELLAGVVAEVAPGVSVAPHGVAASGMLQPQLGGRGVGVAVPPPLVVPPTLRPTSHFTSPLPSAAICGFAAVVPPDAFAQPPLSQPFVGGVPQPLLSGCHVPSDSMMPIQNTSSVVASSGSVHPVVAPVAPHLPARVLDAAAFGGARDHTATSSYEIRAAGEQKFLEALK
eukprot:gene46321-biopygen97792